MTISLSGGQEEGEAVDVIFSVDLFFDERLWICVLLVSGSGVETTWSTGIVLLRTAGMSGTGPTDPKPPSPVRKISNAFCVSSSPELVDSGTFRSHKSA